MHQVEPMAASVLLPPPEAGTPIRQMALVAHFGAMAAQESDLDVILRQACEVASEGTGAAFTGVLQYRAGYQDFVLQTGWAGRTT